MYFSATVGVRSSPPPAEREPCAGSGGRPTAEKTALVTGSSSGVGQATALALAREGYYVLAAMRDPNRAADLLDAASSQGDADRIEVVGLDLLQNSEIIEATVRSAVRRVGHLDVLVNNAGTAEGGAVEEIPVRLWRRVMETNFFGPLACIRAAVPGMREQGSGAIVNVTSINGRVSGAGGGPYAASKFALEALSEALRLEMNPFGVTVVIIQPGLYKTAIWGRPYEVNRDPKSPYAALNRDMAEFFENGWRDPAVADPAEVGQLVCAILREDHPTLRYPIGRVGGGLSARELIDFWIKRPWEEVEARYRDE